MFEFNYDGAEKHHDDVFTVMGQAIRKYYSKDETKIPAHMARVMAKIIDEGFLDAVLEQHNDLANYEKKRLESLRFEANVTEQIVHQQQRELNRITVDIKRLEAQKEELQKEPDQDLRNAKNIFQWVKNETGDERLASKAMNSYFLGKATREQLSLIQTSREDDGDNDME